jgi:hypothetical protein
VDAEVDLDIEGDVGEESKLLRVGVAVTVWSTVVGSESIEIVIIESPDASAVEVASESEADASACSDAIVEEAGAMSAVSMRTKVKYAYDLYTYKILT